MKSYIAIISLCCFLSRTAVAQLQYDAINKSEKQIIIQSLHAKNNKKHKIESLLSLAYYYLFNSNENKAYLDSAASFTKQAILLSDTIQYPQGTLTARLYDGMIRHERGDNEQAVLILKHLLAESSKNKMFALAARTCYELGNIPDRVNSLNFYKRAKVYFIRAGDKIKAGLMEFLIVRTVTTNYPVPGEYFPGYYPISPDKIPQVNHRLSVTKSMRERLDLLLRLASIYLYRIGEEKQHLDSAMLLLDQAKKLSMDLKSVHGYNEAWLLTAGVYQDRNDPKNAIRIINILDDSSRIKLYNNLCNRYWYLSNNRGDLCQPYIDSCTYFAKKCLSLSIATKNQRYIVSAMDWLISIGAFFSNQNKVTNMYSAYSYILEKCSSAGYPSRAYVYALISQGYSENGDYYRAVYYGQFSEKYLDSTCDYWDHLSVYVRLYALNYQTGNYKQALTYCSKILDGQLKYRDYESIPFYTWKYATILIKLHRAAESLKFLYKTMERYPASSVNGNLHYRWALAQTYEALKNDDLAEKYYLETIKWSESTHMPIRSVYVELAEVYLITKNYRKAQAMMIKADSSQQVLQASALVKLYTLKARIDSALGNYKAAFDNISLSKKLSDSIYSDSKERHTQELEFQYQTQKREVDLKLKEEKIRFLNQSALLLEQRSNTQRARLDEANILSSRNQVVLKLKQKDINLLNQKEKLQAIRIQKKEFQQSVILGAAIILLLGTLVLYRSYRLKKHMNRTLELQKQKIEANYDELEQLVSEKEWLLKEIHHRVKNNLHTVMSLLESQAAFLENDSLTAIKNSQHRIFAMSLIHQKLYQGDDVKAINMAQYIPELQYYLADSFALKNNIQFVTDIENVDFDISEAVPLGLILNEIITNSLKYAFKDRETGIIEIKLKRDADNSYTMSVSDNGIGLPPDFDILRSGTLGMKLIKGLTSQLKARLSMSGSLGTEFIISELSPQTLYLRTSSIEEGNL